MKNFLVRRWFLLALVLTLASGIAFAESLERLSQYATIRYGIVAIVLFLMSLPLNIKDMWRAMRQPWAPLLASFVNFGLLPLAAWAISQGLNAEFGLGLLVAATTPATLASASVWTRRAGGNDSVAILVTVLTNASCFVVTPLWLLVLTGQNVANAESLQLPAMITKLGLLVVLPMTLAQLLRIMIRPIAWWSTENKTMLGVLAQCGVLAMVFMGSIRTGLRLANDNLESLQILDFAGMVTAVVVLHVAMLAVGIYLAKSFRMPRSDQIAVGIAGSQKTLMVGLQVGMELGFSILPMVTYHVGQLFLDTLVADRWRERGARSLANVESSEGAGSES